MSLDPMKQHGVFSWNELMTTDVEAAKSFYSALFGWQIRDADGPMPYSMAKVGEQDVAGIMPMAPEAQGQPPAWGAYVTVDDVDACASKTEQLGGKVVLPAQDIPDVGRFAVISDPQGAILMIITYSM